MSVRRDRDGPRDMSQFGIAGYVTGRIRRMMSQWRSTAIFVTLAVWFVSLFGAVAEQQTAARLAVSPVVNATVRSTWRGYEKGPVKFAHLVFDRKRPDGQTVHCDVPAVNVSESGRKLSPGDTIRIVPMPDECWEPDVICETCAPVTPRQIAMMYVVSALSGLLFGFLAWRAIRDLRRDGAVNAKFADLPRS
jgi:hypothetical protein